MVVLFALAGGAAYGFPGKRGSASRWGLTSSGLQLDSRIREPPLVIVPSLLLNALPFPNSLPPIQSLHDLMLLSLPQASQSSPTFLFPLISPLPEGSRSWDETRRHFLNCYYKDYIKISHPKQWLRQSSKCRDSGELTLLGELTFLGGPFPYPSDLYWRGSVAQCSLGCLHLPNCSGCSPQGLLSCVPSLGNAHLSCTPAHS